MSNFSKNTFAIFLLFVLVFFFRETISNNWSSLYNQFFPCRNPIEYSIGSLDPEFGVPEDDFLRIINEAELLWEDAYGGELFLYVPENGSLKINMVYDYRQEVTNKIGVIGSKVAENRASYDALKAEHQRLETKYLNTKSSYEIRAEAFNQRQAEYAKEVDYWNSRGGAPNDKYETLNKESEMLKIELASLRGIEQDLRQQVAEINKLVGEINTLARALNLNVDTLNTIGESRGEEFTQGEYKSGHGGREINIYEFSSEIKLKRVIAHELGHALGLEHTEDPSDIMYYLNADNTDEVSAGDLRALRALCKVD